MNHTSKIKQQTSMILNTLRRGGSIRRTQKDTNKGEKYETRIIKTKNAKFTSSDYIHTISTRKNAKTENRKTAHIFAYICRGALIWSTKSRKPNMFEIRTEIEGANRTLFQIASRQDDHQAYKCSNAKPKS
jgi:hypothetical protein